MAIMNTSKVNSTVDVKDNSTDKKGQSTMETKKDAILRKATSVIVENKEVPVTSSATTKKTEPVIAKPKEMFDESGCLTAHASLFLYWQGNRDRIVLDMSKRILRNIPTEEYLYGDMWRNMLYSAFDSLCKEALEKVSNGQSFSQKDYIFKRIKEEGLTQEIKDLLAMDENGESIEVPITTMNWETAKQEIEKGMSHKANNIVTNIKSISLYACKRQ